MRLRTHVDSMPFWKVASGIESRVIFVLSDIGTPRKLLCEKCAGLSPAQREKAMRAAKHTHDDGREAMGHRRFLYARMK